MAKKSTSSSPSKDDVPVDIGKKKTMKKRPRPEVQVVVAGTGFPISKKPRSARSLSKSSRPNDFTTPTPQQHRPNKSSSSKLYIDIHQAKKEIRNYGATAFTGHAKKSFEDEQYNSSRAATGRNKKCHPTLPAWPGKRRPACKRVIWPKPRRRALCCPNRV